MKLRAPLLLVLVTSSYLLYLLWMTLTQFTPVVAGRLALSTILIVLVLRGSRIAGNILAILCALSGVVLVVAAVSTFGVNPTAATMFVVMAALLFGFSAYVLFNSELRAFQAKSSSLPIP